MRILILGGTGEGFALAERVAGSQHLSAVYSVAGRTRTPRLPPVECRSGGFGGTAGLAAYLRDHAIDLLVDATHPFAAQMSRHAVAAGERAGIPVLAVRRPAWQPGPGDAWTMVAEMADAPVAIGPHPARALLTIGQIDLAPFRAAPQHSYLIRSVETPPQEVLPPHHRLIRDRGPFTLDGERRLLADGRIEVLVTKNSGGAATAPKLAAARELGVQVIMVARPALPTATAEVGDADAAFDWLCAHHAAPTAAAPQPTRRGV
ncbi:MAG: cobalt-precorrin-6A reductase [Rhodospirillaceae bacterium]|nr:cobalt-precorrin-6A reductase [Rhodospirillaceae bacterium]